jgi:hypothetical protein
MYLAAIVTLSAGLQANILPIQLYKVWKYTYNPVCQLVSKDQIQLGEGKGGGARGGEGVGGGGGMG